MFFLQSEKTLIDIEECSSNCTYCLRSEDIDSNRLLVEQYPRKKSKTKQREETSLILVMYRLTPKLEFLMIKQKQSGLLSGLWSFFEINLTDNLDLNTEQKRKNFIIDHLQNQTISINNIKLAGQVINKILK